MVTNYNFTQLDNEVLDRHGTQLGANGLAVYWALKRRAQGADSCFPSQEDLAALTGTSRSTVNRTIKALVEAGLVKVEHRYSDNKQTVNVYRLLPVAKEQPAEEVRVYPVIKDWDLNPLDYMTFDEQPLYPVAVMPPKREELTMQAVYADIAAIRRLNRDFLASLEDDEATEPDAPDLWGQAAD